MVLLLWLVLADFCLLLQCTIILWAEEIKGGRVEIGVIELSCLQWSLIRFAGEFIDCYGTTDRARCRHDCWWGLDDPGSHGRFYSDNQYLILSPSIPTLSSSSRAQNKGDFQGQSNVLSLHNMPRLLIFSCLVRGLNQVKRNNGYARILFVFCGCTVSFNSNNKWQLLLAEN